MTSSFGSLIEYDFRPTWSVVLSVQQRESPYISAMFGPPGSSGVTIHDGFGNFVDLRTVSSRLYDITFQHDF